MEEEVFGSAILPVAVDKGHIVCLWGPIRPDRLNTVLGDMTDSPFLGLVQEWAACD